MTEAKQRLEDLDPQIRAVIAAQYAALEERAQMTREVERLTAETRQRHRQLCLSAMGEDLSAAIQRYQELQAEEGYDITAVVRAMKEQLVAPPGVMPGRATWQPPALIADNSLLAVLQPSYVYEVAVETAAFIKDERDLPLAPFTIDGGLGGKGSGFGDGDRTFTTRDVSWIFRFVPPESRFYDFYPTTWGFGTYHVMSDDNILTSDVAHVAFRLRGVVNSGAPNLGTPQQTLTLLDKQGDNINEFGWIGGPGPLGGAQLHLSGYLDANSSTVITLTHELYVYARGLGTWADLDFETNGSKGQQSLGPVWCYVF